MTDLTAVDILNLPDDTILDHAKAWNARLLKSVPSGLPSTPSTPPHHVASAVRAPDQLAAVYDAVGATIANVSASALELTAIKLATWNSPRSPASDSPVWCARQVPP